MVDAYFQNPKKKDLRQHLRNNATESEQILWQRLKGKQFGHKFIRQYGIGRYIADFYCPAVRLVIELDGAQHAKKEALEYDLARTAYFKFFNIKVLRFWNSEVMNNIEGVCEEILRELEE